MYLRAALFRGNIILGYLHLRLICTSFEGFNMVILFWQQIQPSLSLPSLQCGGLFYSVTFYWLFILFVDCMDGYQRLLVYQCFYRAEHRQAKSLLTAHCQGKQSLAFIRFVAIAKMMGPLILHRGRGWAGALKVYFNLTICIKKAVFRQGENRDLRRRSQ